MVAFSFAILYSTNKVSNSYSHMLGWGLVREGGLSKICGSRVGAYSRGACLRIYGILFVSPKVWVKTSFASPDQCQQLCDGGKVRGR